MHVKLTTLLSGGGQPKPTAEKHKLQMTKSLWHNQELCLFQEICITVCKVAG